MGFWILVIAAGLLMAGVPLSKVLGGLLKFYLIVIIIIAVLVGFAMLAFAGVNGPSNFNIKDWL